MDNLKTQTVYTEVDVKVCPVCKGSGTFELPKNIKQTDLDIKKYLVKILLKNGYGVRQIQRALGYKSPQSISLLIKSLKQDK